MNDRGLFSPVVLGFLIAGVVATFALSVLLATFGTGERVPYDATSTSPSAIGHKGFYTLLEKQNVPVARSRLKGRVSTGPNGLLIVAEPDRGLIKFGAESELGTAPNVLLVLPKWWGGPDFFHDGWVGEVTPTSEDVPRKSLALLDKTAKIERRRVPAAWTRNTLGAAPAFDGDVQLMSGSKLEPLIADGDRILLGALHMGGQRIWVLSDPDPIENHGIATPANTLFALALVAALRGADGRVVFDEAVHGAVAPELNPLQLLFKFPFVIVTVEILVALALLLLAATGRFGRAEEALPDQIGKRRLIDNIAGLMDRAGHQASILRRYLSVKLADAGRALHAPAGLDEPALAVWLDRIGRARGVEASASAILAEGGARRARLFDQAQSIYRWSRNLLYGSAGRQDQS